MIKREGIHRFYRQLSAFAPIGILIFATLIPTLVVGQASNVFSTPSPSTTVNPAPFVLTPSPSTPQGDLEAELARRRKNVSAIEQKVREYQRAIEQAQGRSATLGHQIGLLRNRIAKTQLDMEATQESMEETKLEMQSTQLALAETDGAIRREREAVERLLQFMERHDAESFMEVLIAEQRLSDFIDALVGAQTIEEQLNVSLRSLDALRVRQQLAYAALKQKSLELENGQEQLVDLQNVLGDEQSLKESLVDQTRLSESRYQTLLRQARQEQLGADREIRELEQTIREQLARSAGGRFNPDIQVSLIWPVSNQGISAGFRDPTYIFREIFEHPAIDIRTLVGGVPTNGQPIRAAASGYVARAKDGGMGYSYIMLIHNKRVSTVYGHVLRIDVKEGTFVAQGQIIGLTGGRPGTPGAGRLTTGPHLHFEVRVDGIPVNPLQYLP